jgi:hypothetical protein
VLGVAVQRFEGLGGQRTFGDFAHNPSPLADGTSWPCSLAVVSPTALRCTSAEWTCSRYGPFARLLFPCLELDTNA